MPQHLTDITISEVSLVDAPANKGARVMLYKKDFTDDERKQLAGTGAALPDGSFPIENKGDLANAIHAFGRAKDKAKAKAHIISRAKTLGASDMIPEDWGKRAVAKDAADGDGAVLFDDAVDAKETDEDASGYAEAMCEEIDEANCALHESIRSILDDDSVTDKQKMLEQTFEQYKAHVGAIVPEEMEKALAAAVAKATQKDDKDMTQDEFKKAIADEVKKAVDPLQAAVDAGKATIDKLTTENAVLKLSDKHKGYMDAADMSEEQKKKFAAKSPDERDAHMADNPVEKRLPAHIQKALAEGEEMKKRLAALEDDKALATLKKRAVDAGLPEDFGEVLQKAERGDKEALGKIIDKHAEVAKARDAALRVGGVFKEFGTSRGASGNAYDILTVKAEELRKADASLTEAQAFAKAYSDPANRDLVAQEKRERMAKVSAAA
jgi:hypothetical protein